MGIYLFIIFIAIILLLIRNSGLFKNFSFRVLIYFCFIIFLFIIYVFRSIYVGKDYSQYYTWYNLYNLSSFKDAGREMGYAYLSLIARYFANFKIIPIFTFVIVLFGILFVKRCSNKFINGFTLLSFFILLGLFTSTFNPIRESIAFGFICFGIGFLLIGNNKFNLSSIFNYIFYFISIFIAYEFHKTAIFGLVFIIFIFLKHRYEKKSLIIIGIFMIWISFKGYMNKIFTKFISLDSYYNLKYQHTTLNNNLSFAHMLINLGPLIVQLIFLYIFVSKYNKVHVKNLNFILWGYLFYLFMFTAPGSNIARRLQMYTFIFPLIYSCIFLDGIDLKGEKVDKISNVFKLFFISFWVIFYVLKLYINASGIVPYFI